MSADHYETIRLRLHLEGIKAENYERSGQLICVTAEELLARFIRNGVLDENVFRSTIAGLIEQVRASVSTDGYSARVRVFGEMVSQLRSRDLKATTRLEELWNDVIREHAVSLLCTYALVGRNDAIPEVLTSLHSHNIERQ